MRIHINSNSMKTAALTRRGGLMSSSLFHVTGLLRLVFLFLMLPLTTPCFSDPQTNAIPWSDNFETYTNLTPLVDGTNGWYASSINVIVQTNTVKSGTNAAMIPPDCTLSNWFVSASPTNVWIQMDVMPMLNDNDATNHPVVDTNVALMFYVNSNGNFVVHNGPATNTAGLPDPANSVNWVVTTGLTISTNSRTWVRINMYEDFAKTNCSLYANGILLMNSIGFINTNLTNFTGFDIYNDGKTSYVDNVSVVPSTTNLTPPLIVVPPALSQSLYADATVDVTPFAQTVQVINVWSSDIGFRVATNQNWITASPPNGTVTNGTTQNVVLTYANTMGWAGGVSNAAVTVVATNATAPTEWGTQTVQVVLNMLVLSNCLSVTPLQFSNVVWKGSTPSNRTVAVRNLGDLSFDYTVVTGQYWIKSSPSAGTLSSYGSTNLTLTNIENTANWTAGTTSNALVTVWATNTVNGIFATQTVPVAVSVVDISSALVVTPTFITNTPWIGDKPTNQTLVVSNMSDVSFVYGVRTTEWFISVSPTSGTCAAQNTSTVTLAYRPTWGWVDGTTSNATAIVSSVDGGGATQLVAVILNITAPAVNYYVATNGGNVFPYTNWVTAASNLTSAVYKANFYTNVGTVVWLSNGVHSLPNEVTLSNVAVRSLNGAESMTLIGGTFRGFNLVHTGAVLNGLTITNCRPGRETNGGAIFVSTGLVWNCRLLMNTATNGGGVAVGAGGVVRNSLIWGNKATNGGGVYFTGGTNGLVESSTIASNYAVKDGGGLFTDTITTGLCVNVVVYTNMVGTGLNTNWGTNVNAGLAFSNSCVGLPIEVFGANSLTNIDPLFVDVTTGNCRIVRGSPCFNAGTNQAWMDNALDLAGSVRIRFGRVDIGAYEWYPYQGMGIKVNGVSYKKIKFINGVEPLQVNGIPIQ